MAQVRLGDIIDDYCVKCKQLMNHAIVSMVNDGPAKVRCRTCHNDHDYRFEKAPPTKAELRKLALFNEVLERTVPPEAEAEPEPAESAVSAEDPRTEPPKKRTRTARS